MVLLLHTTGFMIQLGRNQNSGESNGTININFLFLEGQPAIKY